jgi:dihydrodipicolinate synthase/N-acetylneuraminate lyase
MAKGRRLAGTIAAAVTPLRDGGARLDDEAFEPYADYLVGAGLDGILAFGTNGEAVLLSTEERRRGLEVWLEAVAGRVSVAAHCGAQTTADTVVLAAHALSAGADAVAVIGPPYFKLDPREQRAHLLAAAKACAPLPFYVYEFAATAGYAFDTSMLARLREEADNVAGMKVSDAPWDAFERYLLDGFDVFVGPESLIHLGREAGAVGAVSALASAFPVEVAEVVRRPTEEGARALAELRRRIESFPRHAALKRVVGLRGVPVRPDVRPPLRDLDEQERHSLQDWLAEERGSAAA